MSLPRRNPLLGVLFYQPCELPLCLTLTTDTNIMCRPCAQHTAPNLIGCWP